MFRFTLAMFLASATLGLTGCDGAASLTGENETVKGELSSTDVTLVESGEYYDEYTIDCEAGDQYTFTVASSEFDTYLLIANQDASWQEENDDISLVDASQSQLFVTFPNAGRYSVVVTSYEPGETGAYTLTVEQGDTTEGVVEEVEEVFE